MSALNATRSPNLPRLHVPDGCTITANRDGKGLRCLHAAFHEIVSTVRRLGEDIVEIDVGWCEPQLAVKLNESSFENSTNVRRLTVWKCGVQTIAPGTFGRLQFMETLDLGENTLTTFNQETSRGLSFLSELYLNSNLISTFSTAAFARLGNLTTLNLNQNRIFSLDIGTFSGLTKLKHLQLEQNLLLDFQPDTLKGLVSLESFSLSFNRINMIHAGTFQNHTNLKKLSLCSNNINSVEYGAFQDAKALEVLDLDKNYYLFYISTRHFSGLSSLRSLSMNGVGLDIIDNEDLGLILKDQTHSLRELYLPETEFSNRHLPMIQTLKRLETLDLSMNRLGYILDSSLPTVVKNGSLNLRDNKIFYIDGTVFDGMDNSSIHLDGNSFHCTCKLAGFSKWMRSDGRVVKDAGEITCVGPIEMYGKRVVDYDPYWWQCSPYVPLVALVFILGFVIIVAVIVLIIYCNWINLKHWLMERRAITQTIADDAVEPEPVDESSRLRRPDLYRNSLRQGQTGAFVIYDYRDSVVLTWINKYVEDQLFAHPMKITLQWSAGPEVIPLWKQIKDFSFQVNAFLVIVNEEFLEKHWPGIAEMSGVDNIMKCVLVLYGKKKSELPKGMTKLGCPCYQWPESGTRFTTLERERDQFWKLLRLSLKGISK
jgi:Leucine-rich repeat (LRR) protein